LGLSKKKTFPGAFSHEMPKVQRSREHQVREVCEVLSVRKLDPAELKSFNVESALKKTEDKVLYRVSGKEHDYVLKGYLLFTDTPLVVRADRRCVRTQGGLNDLLVSSNLSRLCPAFTQTIHGYFTKQGWLYFLKDYTGVDMKQYVTDHPERLSHCILHSLCVVNHLLEGGVAGLKGFHRDLKLANLLLRPTAEPTVRYLAATLPSGGVVPVVFDFAESVLFYKGRVICRHKHHLRRDSDMCLWRFNPTVNIRDFFRRLLKEVPFAADNELVRMYVQVTESRKVSIPEFLALPEVSGVTRRLGGTAGVGP